MNTQQDLELQRLYESNRHHLSDLVFFDDEVKFIRNLLDKHFRPLLKDTNINRIQLLNSQLTQLVMLKAIVVQDASLHQGHLQSKIKNLLEKSFDFLKLENTRVEDELRDLNKSFKNIKREIFAMYKNLEPTEISLDGCLLN